MLNEYALVDGDSYSTSREDWVWNQDSFTAGDNTLVDADIVSTFTGVQSDKPSQYKLEYKDDSIFLVGYRDAPIRWNAGKEEDHLRTGRYRKTEKFANEHLNTQTEMMRLGALVEAVTIDLGLEDWVEDWNNSSQPKHHVQYDCKGNKYYSDCWWTFKTVGIIHMPEEVAKRVCEILNNKEYEL
jgi:hypothetical protein